jgi:hypothetical protein
MKNKTITRREAISTVGVALASAVVGPGLTRLHGQRIENIADYSLQAGIPGLKIPAEVTVIGCGGFGAWPAMFAAMAGVKRLILHDPAIIDTLDLARAPFAARQVGQPKVLALSELIKELRPDASVETHAKLFTLQDAKALQGVVFDGTNDMELARGLPSVARDRGFAYITGFYKGATAGVMSSYMPGLHFESGKNVPVWTGSAAFSGILALHSAFLEPIAFIGSPSKLNMSRKELGPLVSAMGNGGAK